MRVCVRTCVMSTSRYLLWFVLLGVPTVGTYKDEVGNILITSKKLGAMVPKKRDNLTVINIFQIS